MPMGYVQIMTLKEINRLHFIWQCGVNSCPPSGRRVVSVKSVAGESCKQLIRAVIVDVHSKEVARI